MTNKAEPSQDVAGLIADLHQDADEITCYASTTTEYRPNRSAALERKAAAALERAQEQVREANRLIDKLIPERDELKRYAQIKANEMLAMERDLAAAREDAERYRWLRNFRYDGDYYDKVDRWSVSVENGGTGRVLRGEKLDAAIDAARKENK